MGVEGRWNYEKNTVHIYCMSLLEECMELKIFISGKSNMPQIFIL
jgi:hypothetical protein